MADSVANAFRTFLSAVLGLLSLFPATSSTITTSTPSSNATFNNHRTLRVGTWNALLSDDEYHPDWGCPIQIKICGSTIETRTNCTRERQMRIWDAIESKAKELDVLCLQEVEDTFLELRNNNSRWEMVARSGECTIFISESSRRKWELVNATDVYMPSLSGCPSVPMIYLKQQRTNGTNVVTVASLHVQASVSNMTAWYASAVDAIERSMDSVANFSTTKAASYAVILGGDFNHNITTKKQLPDKWDLVHSDTEQLLLKGTTQKEHNWMGMFDGFLVRAGDEVVLRDVNTVTAGFMPKVVQDLPQGGIVQRLGSQFKTEDSLTLLLFSETGREPFESVPQSNPRTEALSDHLLVTATYLVDERVVG